jgi:hypothetical protein
MSDGNNKGDAEERILRSVLALNYLIHKKEENISCEAIINVLWRKLSKAQTM